MSFPLVSAADDSTACSVTNLKPVGEDAPYVPELFQPPVTPGGLGFEKGCEGWNACPCEEACERKEIASCEAGAGV